MKFFLPIVMLFCVSRNILGQLIQQEKANYDDDISYQDLKNINASCYPFDSCTQDRQNEELIPPFGYKCSCNSKCWEIGTCCIDSPYRGKPPIQKCLKTSPTLKNVGYYMEYNCPEDELQNDWSSSEADWGTKEYHAPTTSLDTKVTYKNYMCFRYYEKTKNFVQWNLFLVLDNNDAVSSEYFTHRMRYNRKLKTWQSAFYEDGNPIPVPAHIIFEYPDDYEEKPISCDPDLIADCPDSWTDKRVHDKCLEYTAIIYQRRLPYKNVHCAICNYVPLDELNCKQSEIFVPFGIFPFRNLPDINESFEEDGKCGNGRAISYQDLVDVNATCYPFDSCEQDREDETLIPPVGYKCSCHRQCWEIGNCCIDSPYRSKRPILKCQKTSHTSNSVGYYMVSECPNNTNADSIWKENCEKEWNGEDDILVLSPVTSIDTSATYKNYYCFRCHERTDNYVSWNLFLVMPIYYRVPYDSSNYNVTYTKAQKTWVAEFDNDGNRVSFPAKLSFDYPDSYEKSYDFPLGFEGKPIKCDPDLIADCPESWRNERVRSKCLAYTAVIYQGRLRYKNVHCALCNYAPLNELLCKRTVFAVTTHTISFRRLFDINEPVGEKEKCDKDHLWDPYRKKCQKPSCAFPGYIMKENRCVPP